MKKLHWLLLAIIIVLILTGAFFAGRMVRRPSVSSQATSQSSLTSSRHSQAASTSSSTSKSSSPSNSQGEALHCQTITPMQTAAAIAYYGQHQVHKQLWKELFDGTEDLDLYQHNDAPHLNVKGRGNSWMLHPSNEGGGHMATYTVGSDGTVAFYDVSSTNKNQDKDPYTTVNLRDIIQYVNSQGAAGQVRAKAQHIHLQQ